MKIIPDMAFTPAHTFGLKLNWYYLQPYKLPLEAKVESSYPYKLPSRIQLELSYPYKLSSGIQLESLYPCKVPPEI